MSTGLRQKVKIRIDGTSPFEFRKPVSGKQFLNKNKELQILRSKLINPALIFVTGYKGTGKTSFALRLADQLKRKYKDQVVVYLSLRGCKSDQEIMSHCVMAVANGFSFYLEIESLKIDPVIDPIVPAEFAEVLAKKTRRKVVLIIDDFDVVCGIPGQHNVEKLLKSLVQRQTRISMCIFSKKTYEAINLYYKHSFISNAIPITYEFIEFVKEEDWYRYTSSIFKRNNQSIGKREVKYMMSKMHGLSKYMQSLSHYIYLTGKSKITINVIENTIETVVELDSPSYRTMFSRLTKYQKSVLIGYATGKPFDVTSRYAIKTNTSLEDIITIWNKSRYFLNPYFEHYLKKQIANTRN